MREKLRTDKTLPSPVKSKRLIADPRRARPYTLSDEPTRLAVRTDMELPKWKKSKMETPDPNRVNPKTDKLEPNRAKLRVE
jgi:hypothetical protein